MEAEITEEYFTRAPSITAREMDGAIFLADSSYQMIYHLNPTSAALWRLLEEPLSMDQIITVFKEAFPDVQSDELEEDIEILVDELVEDELLVCEEVTHRAQKIDMGSP